MEFQNAKRHKRCGVCNIIIEGKFYTFENTKTILIMNKNLSCNSKNIAYKIQCYNCKKKKKKKNIYRIDISF